MIRMSNGLRFIRRISSMPLGKLGKRRLVVIPQVVCDEVGLKEGDLIELLVREGTIIITPKKVVDADKVSANGKVVSASSAHAEISG